MADILTAPIPPGDAETWIFDLDNTLYAATSRIFDQIDARICGFIAEFLELDRDEAYRIQKLYFREHGTTMRGLMDLHDMDPTPFLDHVHDIDLTSVAPDPALNRALGRIHARKVVFTNADSAHAERILDRIGIRHHFEGVFDIIASAYVPKPERRVYDAMVQAFDIEPTRAVMVEDMARNLEPAAALGMTTVWVENDTPWGVEGRDAPYVHHHAHDLPAWIEDVLG